MPKKAKRKAKRRDRSGAKRDVRGRFPKGVSGNPKGKPPGTRHGLKALLESINRVEQLAGENLYDHIVKRAFEDRDLIMAKLLDKLVTTPRSIELVDPDAAEKTQTVRFEQQSSEKIVEDKQIE